MTRVAGSICGLLLSCAAAACVTGGGGTSRARGLDTVALARSFDGIAARVRPGVLGVAVKDLATGDTWHREGERPFAMQSVFKAPLGAAVLGAVDRGELALARSITLTPAMLSPPYSPISARYPERRTYTVEELLVAAAGGSDNTAADVLMELAGGPAAVTQWLVSRGVHGMRIDRYEREFQMELAGLPAFRPEWANEKAMIAAIDAVPEARRREAAAAYLADPRDTSTPLGAISFLEQLAKVQLLGVTSTERLLRIMTETRTGARRIKAALPDEARVAHKTGSARPVLGMNPAINDIGIVTLPGGRRLLIAVFLESAIMPYEDAETIHADVTRAVLESLEPLSP